MQIIDILKSPVKNKRYRVILSDGKKFDFGQEGEHAYVDHRDHERKARYISRHLGNKTEHNLITNLIPSPSLFSYFLLWGTPDLYENIRLLNILLKKKHS